MIASGQVIGKLKATFARYRIPEVLVGDNGPQLVSEEFRQFNEKLLCIVQVVKETLRQDDPLLALMVYRATPSSSTRVSPAELLLGHKNRTTLPTLSENLDLNWPNKDEIKQSDVAAKQKQAYYQGSTPAEPWRQRSHETGQLEAIVKTRYCS